MIGVEWSFLQEYHIFPSDGTRSPKTKLLKSQTIIKSSTISAFTNKIQIPSQYPPPLFCQLSHPEHL